MLQSFAVSYIRPQSSEGTELGTFQVSY